MLKNKRKNIVITIAPPILKDYIKLITLLESHGWREECPSQRYWNYNRWQENGMAQYLRIDYYLDSKKYFKEA
jgi:hypothetical protein